MNTILLGNLIKIRWIAIIGQLVAIFFVKFIINIEIPFYESLTIILSKKAEIIGFAVFRLSRVVS